MRTAARVWPGWHGSARPQPPRAGRRDGESAILSRWARARVAAQLGTREIVEDAVWVDQPAAALVAALARPYAAGLPGLTEETIDAFARAWLAYADRIVRAAQARPALPSPHWDDVAPGSPEDLARKTAVLTLTTARRWRETFDACPTATSRAIFYGLTAWVGDGAVLEDALGLPDGPQIRVQPLVDGGPAYLTIAVRRSGRRVAVIDDTSVAAGWALVHTPPGATLVMLAHHFLMSLRVQLEPVADALTVEQVRLLLASVLPRPVFDAAAALRAARVPLLKAYYRNVV